jgi:hypothetical protein
LKPTCKKIVARGKPGSDAQIAENHSAPEKINIDNKVRFGYLDFRRLP